MMKKSLGFVAAAGALVMGASTAVAAPTADANVSIRSTVPVPGGFTAGSWNVGNVSQGTLPAGTTFLVTFSSNGTSTGTGVSTLTTLTPDVVAIAKLNSSQYRITAKVPMGAGQAARGYWSDSHLLNFGQRDKVTISLESTNGVTDTNAKNNVVTYDNGGTGF